MIDNVFRLLNQMDSFKKVMLFFLTGLTALCIFLGYKLVESYDIYVQWISSPHIIKAITPCNLIQLRKDIYLVSIRFPIPSELEGQDVVAFASSFWVYNNDVNNVEFNNHCKALIKAINSNEAESILSPYQDGR